MDSKKNKNVRIELEVSATDQKVFKQAQELSGDKTISSFIVRVLRSYSEELLAKKQSPILASERDRLQFFEAVFSDASPNLALAEAAAKYKSEQGSK